MVSRFAVAIGIKNSGKLTPLLGAPNDARRFAEWAERNGYKTHIVTDEKGRVTFAQLKELIDDIVTKNDVERLLIFYTGHGISNTIGDFWLLSGFDKNGNEAVNLSQTQRAARRHHIGQLAVFADCCRSSVAAAGAIGGGILFDNSPTRPDKLVEYDEFQATDAGFVAQEVRVEGADPSESYGVFSKCLLDALAGRVPQAFAQHETDRLITSISLADWLEMAVPLESGKIPGGVVQQASISTGWRPPKNVYLGSAPTPSAPPTDPDEKPRRPRRDHPPVDGDEDDDEILRRRAKKVLKVLAPYEAHRDELSKLIFDAQFHLTASFAGLTHGTPGLEVRGDRVERAVCESGWVAAVLHDSRVDATPDDQPCSVALRLADGRWAPSLILPNFIGSLGVKNGAALSLSYVPILTPAFTIENDARVVAEWTAAMIVGKKPSPQALTDLAENLRNHKHRNPALGILAAYAYDRAGRLDEVRSIAGYFLERDGFVPYDVAALIGFDELAPRMRSAIAGKYPLLALGWTLLEEGRAHPALLELRRGLAGGPWVTLEAREGERLAVLLEEGSLQEHAPQDGEDRKIARRKTKPRKGGAGETSHKKSLLSTNEVSQEEDE